SVDRRQVDLVPEAQVECQVLGYAPVVLKVHLMRAILAGDVTRSIEPVTGSLTKQERRKRAPSLLAGVQRDRGIEIGEVLRPGNVRQAEAVVVGVVVIVTPLERVGAVHLGHVVPEFDDDVIGTVRSAYSPGGGPVVKILDRKVEVAVRPV